MNVRTGDRSVAFVGDVHLDRGDPDLELFLRFLERLGRKHGRIVLLGDLFNVWLGHRELEGPHQTAVVELLAGLRRAGVSVRYVEGNRDFHISAAYLGSAFDDVSYRGLVERVGTTRLLAIHGDRANRRDRQYRAWSGFARSRPVWALFNLLPAGRRLRLAETLERRFRATNLRYKRRFPEAAVRDYAAGLLRAGNDVVVLGHFHQEKDLHVDLPDVKGRVLVLPEWKGSRRHLEVHEDGTVGFVDSATG